MNSEETEIIKSLMEIEPCPDLQESDIIQQGFNKVSLTKIASFGVAFELLPEIFSNLTHAAGSRSPDKFYKVIYPKGVSGELVKAKDGLGYRGFIRDEKEIVGQAKFVEVSGGSSAAELATTINPVLIFMAVALMDIDEKLDDIEETTKDIFEFLEQKEEAELKGDLNTLIDVLNNYKFNWDNDKYKSNKHAQVQEIKREAEKGIAFRKKRIEEKMKKDDLLIVNQKIKAKREDIQGEFKEYQLALYLYAFSSFLEVMLLENFDSGYLESVNRDIESRAVNYRIIYTDFYNQIEKESASSIQSNLFGGVAAAGKIAGETIAKIPLVSKSPVDEALIDGSEKLQVFNSKWKRETLINVTKSRLNDIQPFIDSIDVVNRIHNQHTELYFDDNNLYIE